jgi:septal ring factor EnvC (AmiA/AmiB activator)
MGKITDEELKQIGELKQQTTQIVYSLGELQYQRLSIEVAEEELKSLLKETKLKESNLLKDLKEKYGNVTINIETGEF